MTSRIRQLRTADYPFVISVIDQWWGGRQMADKLPRLFFDHFTDTSFAADRDGKLAGLFSHCDSDAKHTHDPQKGKNQWIGKPTFTPGSKKQSKSARNIQELWLLGAQKTALIGSWCHTFSWILFTPVFWWSVHAALKKLLNYAEVSSISLINFTEGSNSFFLRVWRINRIIIHLTQDFSSHQ